MEKKTEGITMEQIIQYIIAATLIMLTVISILNYGTQKDIEAHIENIARRMNVNRSEDVLDEIERELNNRKD
jgi:large-conductance mechanosensitive channel